VGLHAQSGPPAHAGSIALRLSTRLPPQNRCAPELRDTLVIGGQTAQKPHDFDVATALGFQTMRCSDLLPITIDAKLQQVARMVAMSASCSWLGTLGSQPAHLQGGNECVDYPTEVVTRNKTMSTTGNNVP